MIIESSEFLNNQKIPSRYTCNGANISPPLSFAEIPPGTESLVLIVEDLDATNGTWVHWLVWDINSQTAEVQEDSVPDDGTEGTTSFGTTGYGGPCPSSGTHHYIFKLFAMDTLLGLTSEAQKDELLSVMEGHIIGEADPLVGLYSREN